MFALGFFSTVMITSYISFVPEETMESFLARVRARLGGSRFGPLRRLAEAGAPGTASKQPEPVAG